MSREIQVVHSQTERRSMESIGDTYRFVLNGEETDGTYCLIETWLQPDAGPQAHIQTREEELFFILEGEVTFHGESGSVVAGPGAAVNIPKGAPHRFRNESGRPARMLILFAPAGLEKMFTDMEDVPDDDIAALGAVAEGYGVRFAEGV
ncbi:MAG: cupin domain-containing protein [Miltoncostaeaceae bacterium]